MWEGVGDYKLKRFMRQIAIGGPSLEPSLIKTTVKKLFFFRLWGNLNTHSF